MADKMQALTDMLSPVVEAAGVSLYDIELVREGGERILRLYIDKPADSGVDLEDCERVSHAAEAILDAHDPIPYAYALEVSSPGIERKLSRPAHFARYIGHEIRLRLYAPVENRKNFRGKLLAYENEVITLETAQNTTIQFPRDAVAACRLAVFED
ncbi:MAG: ribosome maturation factor RimP [Defluviitaleaceae bacterium]|nr:ribosome maturation factor RimP [Defluviitaleaceae bacterium]MCL2275950.1 ribosome maturation factor RimP [Defluviitaleaceae bacterium]